FEGESEEAFKIRRLMQSTLSVFPIHVGQSQELSPNVRYLMDQLLRVQQEQEGTEEALEEETEQGTDLPPNEDASDGRWSRLANFDTDSDSTLSDILVEED